MPCAGELVFYDNLQAFHTGPCFIDSNCVPNSYSMLLSDFSIMYKASANIAKGQKITKCFADVMSATPFRYVVLKKELRMYFTQLQCGSMSFAYLLISSTQIASTCQSINHYTL